MYCQGCQSFASNGEVEWDIENNDDTTDSAVAVEIAIRVPCGGCGGEFKEGILETSVDVEAYHDDDLCTIQDDAGTTLTWDTDAEKIIEIKGEREFAISDVEVDVTDDYRPKTRTLKKLGPDGKPIVRPVPFRSQRHYYDATVTLKVTCSICEQAFEASVEDSISAGELEEVG
jgi:transcription elongation factor Elf1